MVNGAVGNTTWVFLVVDGSAAAHALAGCNRSIFGMDEGVILLPCFARHCDLSAAEYTMRLKLQVSLAAAA